MKALVSAQVQALGKVEVLALVWDLAQELEWVLVQESELVRESVQALVPVRVSVTELVLVEE